MVQTKHLIQTFCDLVTFDSPSHGERAVCDYLKKALSQLGLEVTEDNTAKKIGGTAGNIYAVLPASAEMEQLPPLLFSGHMDTVQPCQNKQVIVHTDGTITSNGNTVLGADDCSALAAILEALTVIQENQLPHRTIEVLFSVAEETYCAGIKEFDFSKLRSKQAYVLDLSGAVGGAAVQAPTILSFEVTIQGKSSHAGFQPEAGIHAVAVAAEAVQKLQNGWLDQETTRNIGTISGGTATNIVPDSCKVTGEIRSFSHETAWNIWEQTQKTFVDTAACHGASAKALHTVHIHAYYIQEDHPVVNRFKKVCKQQDIAVNLCHTMGGSDNNILSQHGITGIVLATAMNQVHSCTEYTTVTELERIANITVGLMCTED